MRDPRVVAALFALGLLAEPIVAQANGRFPRAQRLLEGAGDTETLVLAATYGILVTHNRGAEWRHICELGFAFSIDDFDPIVDVPGDGVLLAKGARSLSRASAPYCDFEPVLGGMGSETVVDFSIDRSDANHVVALMLRRGDGGGVVNQLYESNDSGETFVPFGTPLPSGDVTTGITLDLAPSDPERIYVSAVGPDGRVFARSDDRAASWTTTALELATDEDPYIAAVHPTDPDVVYVRTDHWVADADGVLEADDALLYSDDGGETFRELERAKGKLFGFALSPEGSRVLLGYGDPVAPGSTVDLDVLGIHSAASADHAFTKIFAGPVSCLTWTATGIYACTLQMGRGFALGFSPNDDFGLDDPNPLEPLLDLGLVAGPVECPACTSVAACRALWPESCAVFENCESSAAATGGSAECPTGGSAGAGGARAGAFSGGSAGRAEAGKRATGESSCGCRTNVTGAGPDLYACVALFVLALARRLRRARSVAHEPAAIMTRASVPPTRRAGDEIVQPFASAGVARGSGDTPPQ